VTQSVVGDLSGSDTAPDLHQQMVPDTIPPSTARTTLSPFGADGPAATDVCPGSTVLADIAVIPDSLDLVTSAAETAGRVCSPGGSVRRTNSLREQVRPSTASSDSGVNCTEQSVHVALHRKQSAEAAALLVGALPPASDPHLPDVGFVPIQNQMVFSRSDSVDSMASVTGCLLHQSVEVSEVHTQPSSIRETVAAGESGSGRPSVQQPGELIDTLQSLLGQLTAVHYDGPVVSTPTQSSSEPAQQLQQSQAIIHQQQEQQLSAIVSAIQNLQHLRTLQEAIGNLAVALKTNQLDVLSTALHAGEVSTASTVSMVPPLATNSGTAVPIASLHTSTGPASVAGPGTVPPELCGGVPPSLGVSPYSGGVLLMPPSGLQQSAAYHQHHQQLLMSQLMSQNAAAMVQQQQQAAGLTRGVTPPQILQQHQPPWPVMMIAPRSAAGTLRRPAPALPLAPGVPGIPGLTGLPGTAGLPGATGLPVAPGLHGLPGMTGLPGAAGIHAAAPGIHGTPGLPVTVGVPGIPAAQGLHGTVGVTGLPGAAGLPVMSAQRLAVTPGSLPVAGTLPPGSTATVRSGAQTPVVVRPPVTSNTGDTGVSSLPPSLADPQQ